MSIARAIERFAKFLLFLLGLSYILGVAWFFPKIYVHDFIHLFLGGVFALAISLTSIEYWSTSRTYVYFLAISFAGIILLVLDLIQVKVIADAIIPVLGIIAYLLIMSITARRRRLLESNSINND